MPLSEKGAEAVLYLFKLFDKNKNGVIEKSELKDAEKLLHSMVLPKARWKLTDMDTDCDGKISSSEWLDAMQKLADASGEVQLMEGLVFHLLDHLSTMELWAANKRFKMLKLKFKFPIARTFELFRARSRLAGWLVGRTIFKN